MRGQAEETRRARAARRGGRAAVALALATALALSGCGLTGGGKGKVTLSLVAADYDVSGGQSSRAYWSSLVAAFEAKHPDIRVEVRIEPWTRVDREVASMVDKGEAPDIAQIGSYADYADRGEIYKADELLSVPVQSNFLAPLIQAGEQRRIHYGLPFVASTRLLFYNKRLFAEAGIDKPPATWKELKEAAELLKEETDATYPFALPLGPEEAQAELMNWLLSGGTEGYVEPGGSYAIDSEENIATVRWLKTNLVDAGLTGPGVPGVLDRKQAFAAFTRGEVGMLNGHPSLIKQATKAGIDLGTVAIPGRTGKPRAAMGVADWIMGFKENGNRAEIGEFLNFLFADENVLAFAAQNDLLPVTVSASESMRTSPAHRKLRVFLDELPTSRLPPVGKTSWTAVSEDIKKSVGAAMAPGSDPEKVLKTIAARAESAEAQEEE
ncbi:extracellular solute-binding protein [Streptomyces sp. NPDC057638]|uniref:extracellular solute-binding protein n=1 Tax=Streptomyces sp. NPDC057638 TaxID=3346190 RepID=UPI0036913024